MPCAYIRPPHTPCCLPPQGLVTVRAFRQQPLFGGQNLALLNHSNRAYWPMQCVNRWLSVRLELLGTSVVFGTALFVAVITPSNAGGLRCCWHLPVHRLYCALDAD